MRKPVIQGVTARFFRNRCISATRSVRQSVGLDTFSSGGSRTQRRASRDVTCSGRTPRPISRAVIPCSQGTALMRRTGRGGLSGSLPGFSAALIRLFCTTTCMACVIRTGTARRRRTASSSPWGGQPSAEIDRPAARQRIRNSGKRDGHYQRIQRAVGELVAPFPKRPRFNAGRSTPCRSEFDPLAHWILPIGRASDNSPLR